MEGIESHALTVTDEVVDTQWEMRIHAFFYPKTSIQSMFLTKPVGLTDLTCAP